jgi:hypothetical protein
LKLDTPGTGAPTGLLAAAGDLNELGRFRVKHGLKCFVHPDGTKVAAVCIDFGLSARGGSSAEAKRELELVISDAISCATDAGYLNEFLNQPHNRAAERQFNRWHFAYRLARVLLSPVLMVWRINQFLGSLFSEYQEPFSQIAPA